MRRNTFLSNNGFGSSNRNSKQSQIHQSANINRSPFIAGYGGGMRTPKAFKPVLESSSSSATDKRGNFAHDKILLSNGGNSY